MEWCNIAHSNNKHIQGLKLQKINNSGLTLETNTTPWHWGSQQFTVDLSSDEKRTSPSCWCPVLRGQRSWPQLLMSPYTPDVCWAAPGTVTRRPLPHRWRPQWSSWCPPGCIARKSSEEGLYCRTDRWTKDRQNSQTLYSPSADLCHFTSAWDSLVVHVLHGERDVLDQHGWLGAEEDAQHPLEKTKNTAEWLNMRPKEPAEATNKRCWHHIIKTTNIFVWDSCVLFTRL